MRKSTADPERLLAIGRRLGDAVINPSIWLEIMQQISTAVGATGAALLQSDVRTPDIPRTPGVDEAFRNYFAEGWHTRDIRAERGVPLLLSGARVVVDQDIVTPDEMRQLPYFKDCLAPFGFKWWAVIGFSAGSVLWGLPILRTEKDGPFEANDKRALSQLAQRLTETASLSKAVGQAVLSSVTNALNLVKQPALAIDRLGSVIAVNAAAEHLFDDEIRVADRRLYVRDQRARSLLDAFVDRLRVTPDTAELPASPIVVQRLGRRPLVVRVLPVDGAARSPFLGARALLVITDLSDQPRPQSGILMRTFGLSQAEARLASLMATGISPEQAAEELGIARETARGQLKAVFAKTDTHRQGELIAMLSRLAYS